MDALRLLQLVWGTSRGWVSVPALRGESWYERWFEWPQDRDLIEAWIEEANKKANVYFSPLVYSKPSRSTAGSCTTRWAWADFDEVDPTALDPKPTVLWETSPGRYQGLYLLKERVDGELLEQLNRRIAHACGADASGWDAGQVLRIPGTRNHKYAGSPRGRIVAATPKRTYTIADLERYSLPESAQRVASLGTNLATHDFAQTLETWQDALSAKARRLLTDPPEAVERGKRSDNLWYLIRELTQLGLPLDAVYTLVKGCAWNKFRGRKDEDVRLRQEIEKALAQDDSPVIEGVPEIVEVKPKEPANTSSEFRLSLPKHNWLRKYVEASERYVTGAPYAYHVACGLALLSVACGRHVLATDMGDRVFPNVWVMIVGPTRSGKSRAASFARRVFNAAGLDEEIPMFNSFSTEGLLKALSDSKDEHAWLFTHEAARLLKALHKRDYLADAREVLNDLYDGEVQARFTIKNAQKLTHPALSFLGITQPDGFLSGVAEADLSTGFLARFLYFYRNQVSPMQRARMAPGYEEAIASLGRELAEIRARVRRPPAPTDLYVRGKKITYRPDAIEVDFSAGAFRRLLEMGERNRKRAQDMPQAAPIFIDSEDKAIRTAMLIALADHPELFMGGVEVTEEVMEQAVQLVEQETGIASELLGMIGTNEFEQTVDRIVKYLWTQPSYTAKRADLFRRFGKQIGTAMKLQQLEDTLVERGLIDVVVEKASKKATRPARMWKLRRRR